MTPSPRIVEFIKGFEAFREHAYMPTPNDRPTIGFGSTGPDTMLGMDPWTVEQATERLMHDLTGFSNAVTLAIAGAPTSQNQFDAMCSLAYNIGATNFRQSSALTNHRAGHYATAALAFGLWNKQRDSHGVLQVLPGLTRRRAAEAAIYSEAA